MADAQPRHDLRTPLVLPRALIFLASLWLVGSWLLAIGLLPPVHPSSSSYEHGLDMMLLCLGTGLMIGWPLLRLSQSATPAPLRQTVLDLLVMGSMIQVIIWPLRLVTAWSLGRTAAIDATLTGWMLLAGAVVASAIGTNRPGPRSVAMLACVAMCLLGPAIAYLSALGGPFFEVLANLSPLMAAHMLGNGHGAPLLASELQLIGVLYVAVVGAWGSLVAWRVLAGHGDANG